MEGPYKVGQILVRTWSNAKTVKYRVVKVIKVNKHRYDNRDADYYSYDIEDIDGKVELYSTFVTSFEEDRTKLDKRLQITYQNSNKLQKKIQDSHKMEKKSIKLFKQTP